MTDPTLQFGATAVADAPTGVLPVGFDDAAEGGGDRRKLMIVGGVGLALVVLVAGFFLMHKGGADVPTGAVPIAAHHIVNAPAATGAASATKPVRLPQQYKGAVGRDPFKPLYAAPVAAPSQPSPAASGPSATTGTPTGSTGTTPTVTVPSTTTTGTTGTGTTAAPTKPFLPVWIELVSVKGTSSATFAVGLSNGSTSKTVTFAGVQTPSALKKKVATQFGKFFSLLSVGSDDFGVYAVIKYVDAAPFDLYLGPRNKSYVGS